jgi:nucleoside-diphosphate-sugar epimerase
VLIVGCGCRGRSLAAELARAGQAVRGTTRRPDATAEIVASGAEAVVADPDRLATLLLHIEGVSVICWLLGSASGDPDDVAALHGARLRSLLERLVDSPVRGFVYEGAGSVRAEVLEDGAAAVRGAAETFRMPVEVVSADPSDHEAWLAAAAAAVERVLGAEVRL